VAVAVVVTPQVVLAGQGAAALVAETPADQMARSTRAAAAADQSPTVLLLETAVAEALA
jgi:hypothetical protein